MPAEDIILYGPREETCSPVMSLGEYLTGRLQIYGEKEAIVQEVDGEVLTLSYLDLLRQGKIASCLLREHGLVSGDTVMLCIGNTIHFVPIMLGALFAGVAVAPVNPGFYTSDLLHLLGVIKPQLLICNEQAAMCVQEAVTQYQSAGVPVITMETVINRLAENRPVDDFTLVQLTDPRTHVAFVMCSSGTSGKPKGVELAHDSLVQQMNISFFNVENEPTAGKDVTLNMSGPYWVSCLISTLNALNNGLKLVLLSPFTEETFLHTIQKYKVNIVILGPDQLIALAKYADFDKYDISSIRSVFYGGAPMSRAMLELGESKLRRHIVVAYGMTECMYHMSPDHARNGKPCNVGKLGKNVAAKVVDLDSGKTVGPNREGELCFKNQTCFLGYRGNPQATRDMFDDEGFLHTGDVGYYDDQGYFYIVDRIKELIKYIRDHVPAVDIEEVLLQHPQVLEVAVIGVYHEVDWEHATAIVALRSPHSVTEEELLKLVEGKLPSFKWLHGGIIFVDSLPRTGTGKIQKYVLRKTYGKRPDA